MRRAIVGSIVLLIALPLAAAAQDAPKPRPEIGFRGGYILFENSGEQVSVLAIPGGSFFDVGTVYLTAFTSDRLALEPQLGFLRIGSESSSNGALTGALQVNQFLRSGSGGSPVVFLTGGFTSGFGDGGGDTFFSAGGGVGYRLIVRETLGVRFEGRYRRHFSDEGSGPNEFGLLIGLGAVLGRSGQ